MTVETARPLEGTVQTIANSQLEPPAHRRRPITAWGIAASLLLAAAIASGQTVVADFNDLSTGVLRDKTGGTGLAGAWSGTATIRVISGNLSAPASTHHAGQSGGAARSVQGDYAQPRQNTRLLAAPIAGVVELSFLVKAPDATSVGGIALDTVDYDGAQPLRIVAVGRDLLLDGPADDVRLPGVLTLGQTALIVGQLEIDAAGTSDTLAVWVNPDELDRGEPDAVLSGADLVGGAVTRVAVVSYQEETGIGAVIDDVRLRSERWDLDDDGAVTTGDFYVFPQLMSGPASHAPPPGVDPELFARADGDRDGDVDLYDFHALALWISRVELADHVHVADFGATPDDGVDDAPMIQEALDYLTASGRTRLEFAAGTYDLFTVAGGSGYVALNNLTDCGVVGATDDAGAPATRLVRHGWLPADPAPPSLLRASSCVNLSVQNLVFDNEPDYSSAGRIVELAPDHVVVEILDGLPRIDGTLCYSSNLWDPVTRSLRHVASVTYKADVDAAPADFVWHTVTGGNGRLMRLVNPAVAGQLALGDLFSWHFGADGIQTLFYNCSGLHLSNLRTVNAVGFAMSASQCRNIDADHVVVAPEGNQLAVSARDGFMLATCDGTVIMRNLDIEGVRWDGQNAHGNFLTVIEKLDNRSVRVERAASYAIALPAATVLTLWNGTVPNSFTLADAVDEGEVDGKRNYLLTTDQVLPEFVSAGTLASADAWDMDSYTVQDSTFREIAGCALILRNKHALIERCQFDQVMYPPILVGASPPEGEGTFPRDITIRDCSLSSSGWRERHRSTGLIGISNSGPSGSYMGAVQIVHNLLSDNPLGIDIADVSSVAITDNVFANVAETHRIDAASTGSVTFDGNTIE